jgi:pimeloyl-ACP methyl ester carboxylesterase
VADAVEAVRAALGYPLINFYGQSYGTLHAQAYALRHGSHLRSLILDGAFSPLDAAEQAGAGRAAAGARSVALVCRRSPSCARDNRHPARALARLAERLRSRPFRGVGRDAEGRRKRLRMDEAMLARIAVQEDFATSAGELLAAFRALRHGDRRPLLRLAAFTGPDYSFEDDYKVESAGLSAAADCVDFPTLWDVTAPLDVRRAQSAASLSAAQRRSYPRLLQRM